MTVKKVLAAEALAENITFNFMGDVYTVPPGEEWDLQVVEDQEAGNMLAAIKGLLGEDQYKVLRKSAKKMKDLNEFYKALYKAIDVDPKD